MGNLLNAATGATLARSVEPAVSPWQRTFGFLFKARIEADCGLWFARCRAIHTLGMRCAIDVVFLTADGRVVALQAAVPPNRPFVSAPGADTILEMGPGFLQRSAVAIGDRLELLARSAVAL